MKFLFVHQNFPGQYLHLVRHLARQNTHEIVFLTEPNDNHIPGVRKMQYRPLQEAVATNPAVQEFEAALLRADSVAAGASELKRLGFTPDIILGHHGWGELLNLPDIWPRTPLLGYFEFYYRTEGLDVGFDPEFPARPDRLPLIRAKNAVNHLALALDQAGQTPTQFQRATYPPWAQKSLRLIPEGADLTICRPDPASRRRPLAIGPMRLAGDRLLVTYVARGLEPYRGFHTMMRALPAIQQRKDVDIAIVGADEVSYGPTPRGTSWKTVLLRELGTTLDHRRIHFLGRIPHALYVTLLQRSDLHLYLTYPFVASWSLREAMACGCAIVGSDTAPVREFLEHGRTGHLVPFPDPAVLADAVLDLLSHPRRRAALGRNARAFAETNLDLADHIRAMMDAIQHLTGIAPTPPKQTRRRRA